MIPKKNEMKSWFFKKINKIDKPSSKLTKRQRKNMLEQRVNVITLRPHGRSFCCPYRRSYTTEVFGE